ncbi:MAG: alpha/beta hydrolase fold domain-containing protein [Thermodesulfobacteriota bacterium]
MGKIGYQGRITPEMSEALRLQAEFYPPGTECTLANLDHLRELYIRAGRYWNADPPELAEIRNDFIAGPAGPIPVRYYFPALDRPRPGLVYLHGGGWIFGDLDTHDKIMRLLALSSGAAVVGVAYRLAPEHKFPLALEETLAVIAFLRRPGESVGIRPHQLALGGDSAGASLAASAALILRDRWPGLLKMLVLYYGHYGLKDSGSRRMFGAAEDGMRPEDLAFYLDCYLRGPEDLNDPRFDLFQADLVGLPPVFLGAARLDPLLDDSLTFKALLDESGVRCEVRMYEGVLHGFLHLSRLVPQAAQALRDGGEALKTALAE